MTSEDGAGGELAASGVIARAPVRVADVGGWTDTWFGAPGAVCHLGVGPGVQVTAARRARRPGDPAAVHLVAHDVGVDAWWSPASTQPTDTPHPAPDLLVGTLAEAFATHPGSEATTFEVTITSGVPAGASLGTSAAVVVALLAAVAGVHGDIDRDPAELARMAHRVETVRVGREAGVQDHWAAAFGGAGLVRIDPYPDVVHEDLALARNVAGELDERLLTVVFAAHDSSAVHRAVIDTIRAHDAGRRSVLDHLVDLAETAAAALRAGDVATWAASLTAATDAQRDLHPDLVGPEHAAAIDVAARLGALGWKVNGAGGGGGSLTVVATDAEHRHQLRRVLAATGPHWRLVDLAIAEGVAVEPWTPPAGIDPVR